MKEKPTTLPQENGSINTRNQEQDGPNTDNENASTSELKSLVVYSKFIFVPGDTQLFFDDFSNDYSGDFPAKWNTYAGGEIVQLSGSNQKWFELKMSSYFIPDVPSPPKKYTIEFDVLTTGLNRQTSSQAKLDINLDESNAFGYGNNAVYTYLQFCQYAAIRLRMSSQSDGKELADNTIAVGVRKTILSSTHISVTVNNTRFCLWINESKYMDVPRLVPSNKINSLKFEPVGFKDRKERLFITNVKVIQGGST